MGLMTPQQVAEELGVSIDQVEGYVNDGALPFVNVGRGEKRPTRRYEPEDIAAFKRMRRQIGCQSTSDQEPAPSPTTSKSGAIDLAAIRERLLSERRGQKKSG